MAPVTIFGMDKTRTSQQSEPNSTRSRFRFSLLSFLLIVTIVGLSVGLWASLGERAALKQQIQDLRNHYEILTIVDPEQIHVLRQETGIQGFERFQVYLPEGREYQLKYDAQDFPQGTGSSAKVGIRDLPPGRYDIRFALQNEKGNTLRDASASAMGYWSIQIAASRPNYMASANHGLPNGGPNWLNNAVRVDRNRYRLKSEEVAEEQRDIHFSDVSSPDKGKVVLFDANEEATLYRYEVRNPDEMIGTLLPHARWEQEVFRVWIEAKPKP